MASFRILPFLLILAAGTLLYFNQQRISSYQKEYNLNRMVNNPEIPLSLSITTIALGPLRTIVADALWWRAIQQQDRGDYFDALQLTDWITKLQPTYPSIWAYQAWNMSYNIAHDFANPEDRWSWIVRSIKLLRDEGLKYNPDNTIIRQELARIFYDRIGNKVDPGAEFFKNQWAFLMMEYFDSGDRSEIENLRRAAKTFEELKGRSGITEYSQAAMANGIDVLDFERFPPKRGWLNLNIPHHFKVQAGRELYYFYKRQKIEIDLKLDIDRLWYIDTEFGPLDWRLHQAHAIYWAAEKDFEDFLKGGINFARVIRQSMIDSFYEGRIFYNVEKNVITRTNNLQIIGRIHDYFEYYMHHAHTPQADALHKHFLEQAVAILYTFNHLKESRELFEHYRDDYLDGKGISFEEFVQKHLAKTLRKGGTKSGRSLVEAALLKSFEWIDIGEYAQSNGYFKIAKLIWQRHQKQVQNTKAKQLPPFEELVAAAKNQFIISRGSEPEEFNQTLKSARDQSPDDLYIGTFEESEHQEK